MSTFNSRWKSLLPLLVFLCFIWLPYFVHAKSPDSYYDDPFYEQKGAEQGTNTFLQVSENIDPFTGNVNLLHTDVILPGNGGMDLKIMRSYNSRIWGNWIGTNPVEGGDPTYGRRLLAWKEWSVMGLGWSLHFGRVRNPEGKSWSDWCTRNWNSTVCDAYNEGPVIEMPDGSLHPMYPHPNPNSNYCSDHQWISKEYWIFRKLKPPPESTECPDQYELALTDGTVYTFLGTNSYNTVGSYGYYDRILQVSTITAPDGNTITFTYNSSNAQKITSITDSTASRIVDFEYVTKTTWQGINWDVISKIKISNTGHTYTHTYTFNYEVINDSVFLSEAVSPVGLKWTYNNHG